MSAPFTSADLKALVAMIEADKKKLSVEFFSGWSKAVEEHNATAATIILSKSEGVNP
ncbi:hypothetical protein [Neorhizobium sp. DAR64860/K0K1]|uniref:hypothetical protein n=1 Tax=Neorhizobium sp. DAR64860/K0K1 TaxID=3421955 RepID=UPI003D2A888B